MIGIPFVFWLLFNLFAFGNIDQLFALLSAIGLVIIFVNFKKKTKGKLLLWDALCFVLLSSPIIARLVEVPIKLFDYGAFKMPLFFFAVCYVLSLVVTAIKILRDKK